MKINDFEVVIQPGNETPDGYIEMPHGTHYSLQLTNHQDLCCGAYVEIEGKPAGVWRVFPNNSIAVEHPAQDTERFTFHQDDTPAGEKSGLIQVTFFLDEIGHDASQQTVVALRLKCPDTDIAEPRSSAPYANPVPPAFVAAPSGDVSPVAQTPAADQSGGVNDSMVYRQEDSEYAVFRGKITLSSGGDWKIDAAAFLQEQGMVDGYVFKSTERPTELDYTIIAIREKDAVHTFPVALRNNSTGECLTITWDTSNAEPDEETVSEDLRKARMLAWFPYVARTKSPVLTSWMTMYDDTFEPPWFDDDDEGLSVFNLLGGRAAVRETLQLQVLETQTTQTPEYTIPVDTIEGVKVRSHPYREMLKDSKGGELALANVVPHDRFFVYIAKPSSIMSFLDKGVEFISDFGAAITGNRINYDLVIKYLAHFGFNENILRKLLKSGAVRETALIFPDVFFIDGTDITIVSRLAGTTLLRPVLKLIGITMPDRDITALENTPGKVSYWSLQKDLLIISTSRQEIEAVLRLCEDAKNSLGQSAEFRYMLTQLPLNDTTRIFAYFSDPFIRRLVCPSVKIGQQRRITARAEMEHITALALLARMDGIKNAVTLEKLAELGYLPPHYLNGEYFIDENLVVHSKTYGILAGMKTLPDVPVENVSKQEAHAYQRYLHTYEQYWRQFFDPVAVRLDESSDGALEMTTFILPLINNSIYDTLRGTLITKEDNVELQIPELSSSPVVMLSVNLSDSEWMKMGEGLLANFFHLGPQDIPKFKEDFGPGLHVAIHDSDPVIALGSGDILGAFHTASGINLGNTTLLIPIVLSILTRPCTIFIEIRNPERIRRFLERAVYALREPERGINVDFYQIEERAEWVLSYDLFGLIKLHFGLEIKENFLLIRNIPWLNTGSIANVKKAPLNGATLQAFPGACNSQLAGLFTAASAQIRAAAMKGIGLLYPLIVCGYATSENAAEKHAALFGFTSQHPGDGKLIMEDGHLVSSQYGSVFHERQPAYKEGDRHFGVLKELISLSVNMQFEQSGLRTKIRWQTR